MAKIPRISGEDAVKAFCQAGFYVDRIRGSHHVLRHPEKPDVRLTIPVHAGKAVGPGLLQSQIKAAGFTVEQFIDLV